MTHSPVTPSTFRPIYEAEGALPVRLETADVEHPPGNHYVHHRLVVGDGRPGVVIAAEANGHGVVSGALLLVLSQRVSVGAELWELPRGSSDAADFEAADGGTLVDDYSDEALIRAGLRELLEETGHAGRNAEVIGRYVTDSTVFPQRIGVVRCAINRDAAPQNTDGEVEEARWFSLEELHGMVRRSEIRDAHTLSALTFLAVRES